MRRFNPIVVKELRQAVRSRFVATAMILFLFVLVLVMSWTLIETSISSVAYNSSRMYAGRSMFSVLVGIMCVTCMVFMPCYTGIRMAVERWGENLDLLYITTIQPGSVVRGKMLATAVLTLLFFSVAAPFMSFTYLLRGLDVITIFIVLAFNYLVIYVASQIAVFLACLPTSRTFKVLLALGLLIGTAICCGATIGLSYEMTSDGIGSLIDTKDFWIGVGVVLGLAVSGCGLLHFLSVALISPESSNRAFPVRLYLTVIWLIWGVVAVSGAAANAARTHTAEEILYSWLTVSTIFLTAALMTVISEKDSLSLRIKRVIPVNRLKRFFSFFFFNGPAGGFIWVAALMCGTLIVSLYCMWLLRINKGFNFNDAWTLFLVYTIYMFAFSLTALLVRRVLFKKARPLFTWVIMVLMISAAAIVPVLIGMIITKDIDPDRYPWYMGNLFTISKRGMTDNHLVFAAVWAVLMLILNLKWFRNQITAFRPLAVSSAETGSRQ